MLAEQCGIPEAFKFFLQKIISKKTPSPQTAATGPDFCLDHDGYW